MKGTKALLQNGSIKQITILQKEEQNEFTNKVYAMK